MGLAREPGADGWFAAWASHVVEHDVGGGSPVIRSSVNP
jgi:hypothetical protein